MTDTNFQKRLIAYINTEFKIICTSIQIPPQGMSSSVFFIKTVESNEYAIKYGRDAMKDVPVLELIERENINIPIPQIYTSFLFEEMPVTIFEKISFPLLESISIDEMPKYIPSMIENLKKLHSIQSDRPGAPLELNGKRSWKGILHSLFNGDEIDWNEISKRKGLDTDLLLSSVEKIRKKIDDTKFEEGNYSLLHTDFNQRNLFVNPESHEIAGIIDWEDALYGDPIYDFARVRMLLWHFDFNEQVVESYYKIMNFTAEQRKLEDLYWLSRVIQYLAWYSEELNAFNSKRIKLHQEYLQEYNWEMVI